MVVGRSKIKELFANCAAPRPSLPHDIPSTCIALVLLLLGPLPSTHFPLSILSKLMQLPLVGIFLQRVKPSTLSEGNIS